MIAVILKQVGLLIADKLIANDFEGAKQVVHAVANLLQLPVEPSHGKSPEEIRADMLTGYMAGMALKAASDATTLAERKKREQAPPDGDA